MILQGTSNSRTSRGLRQRRVQRELTVCPLSSKKKTTTFYMQQDQVLIFLDTHWILRASIHVDLFYLIYFEHFKVLFCITVIFLLELLLIKVECIVF